MMINKRLIGICDDSTKYMRYTIFFNWLSLICNITIIWLIGQFINQIANEETLNIGSSTLWQSMKDFPLMWELNLLVGCIIIILALIGRLVFHHFLAKYSYKASANARVTLRNLIYEKLLRLGMAYQERENTSTIVQMSIDGVEQLEIYFGKYLPQFFYALLAPITLFVVLATISWQAALVFMLCVPLIPVSIIAIMRIAKKILKEYWHNYANLSDTFLENLQGLITLKAYSQDDKKHQEMNEEAQNFRKITMKVLSMQLNSINIMDLVAFGGSALGTIVALHQFRAGNLMIGSLIIIILLSSEFFIPLRLLGSYFHVAMNGMAAAERIFELLDCEEVRILEPQTISNETQLSIDLKKVGFSYDGERQVLRDISFSLTSGGVTAIVGESGSGKSTIASLLLGQIVATEGEVLLNGTNLKRIELKELYKSVILVSAHSHIFKGTIRENLLMANPDASESQMMEALKLARLDEFVGKLPAGIETEILENGSSLSGGQKQRLALARTILANRSLIIFDEATSNIDVDSEELIWKAIYELAKTKTILVISHRLKTLRGAKIIHVLEKGKLVESGVHEELMNQAGVYAQMTQAQLELEQIREVN